MSPERKFLDMLQAAFFPSGGYSIEHESGTNRVVIFGPRCPASGTRYRVHLVVEECVLEIAPKEEE